MMLEGKLRDFRVEVAHDGVVIAARILHAVFNLVQRVLKLIEAFHGAKLRVGFGESKYLAQRGSERAFGFCFRGGPLRAHGAIARSDNIFERALFVRGVALHCFHQIGNQVVAAFELNVDIGPRVVALHLQSDQAVVHADDENHGQDNNRQSIQITCPPEMAR